MSCRRRTYMSDQSSSQIYMIAQTYSDNKYRLNMYKLDESERRFNKITEIHSYSDQGYTYRPLKWRSYNGKIEIVTNYGNWEVSSRYNRIIYDTSTDTFQDVSDYPSDKGNYYGWYLVGDVCESGAQFYSLYPSSPDYLREELYVSYDGGITINKLISDYGYKSEFYNKLVPMISDAVSLDWGNDYGCIYDVIQYNGYYFFVIGGGTTGEICSHSTSNVITVIKVPIDKATTESDIINNMEIAAIVSKNEMNYYNYPSQISQGLNSPFNIGLSKSMEVTIPLRVYDQDSGGWYKFNLSTTETSILDREIITYDGSVIPLKYQWENKLVSYFYSSYNSKEGSYRTYSVDFDGNETLLPEYSFINDQNYGELCITRVYNDRIYSHYSEVDYYNPPSAIIYYDIKSGEFGYLEIDDVISVYYQHVYDIIKV